MNSFYTMCLLVLKAFVVMEAYEVDLNGFFELAIQLARHERVNRVDIYWHDSIDFPMKTGFFHAEQLSLNLNLCHEFNESQQDRT